MHKKFIILEWKSFFRSASVGTDLFMKGFIFVLIFAYGILLLMTGVNVFYGLKKINLDPLNIFNKYLFYYFVIDLIMRLFIQKIPVMNIRTILTMPIKKHTIIHYSLFKTCIAYFNWLHFLLFIPFGITLLLNGYDISSVLSWLVGVFCLIYINNFLNVILNNKDSLFIVFIVLVIGMSICQYYNYFDITIYSYPFFSNLYYSKWLFVVLISILIGLYFYSFNFLKKGLYLDDELSIKYEVAGTKKYNFLNQFGILGVFIKNDLKLILRNKRAKTTILMSLVFLFYGIIFFRNNSHQPAIIHILAGIMVSGGFLFTFGQFVPSWDSSYYPLMMTQNISYRNYLNSKWLLVVCATLISTILASFYLYFSWHAYLCVLSGAIYNIGVNSHLVLLGGAYNKTPIDLASSTGVFGDKKAFNIQTVLISIPKILLPLGLYAVGDYFINANAGLILVGIFGVFGFLFRDKIFIIIEKIYKTEKYKTLRAYKQKK